MPAPKGKGKGKMPKTTATCECDDGNYASDLSINQIPVVPILQTKSGTNLPHLLSDQTGHLPDGPAIAAKPGKLCTTVQLESITRVAAAQEGIPCAAKRPWQDLSQQKSQKLSKEQTSKPKGLGAEKLPLSTMAEVAAVQEGIPCIAQRPGLEPLEKKPVQLNNKQMNKQQTELSWEVTSELGSDLGDETPSSENLHWSKQDEPKQGSLVSYLANFGMPKVPLLQSLLEDVAAELRKYREHWQKRREQYKTYWTNVQDKLKVCLDFFEIDIQELKKPKQKQQEANRNSSPAAVTTPADPVKSGFAGQGQTTQ